MRTYLAALAANGCQTIDRAGIIARLEAHPLDRDQYNQGKRRDGCGHRLDCSGLGSCICGIYLDGPGSWGGMSTAGLAVRGAMYPIPQDQIGPGDFLGLMGPGTDGGGGGHIAPVYKRDGNRFLVRDHGGGLGPGPDERWVNWSGARWAKQGWRYALRSDAKPPTLGDREYARGDFGGVPWDIQGLYNEWAKRWGQAAITVDGDFGPATHGAVEAFQRANGLTVDGVVGPQTSKALRAFYDPVPAPQQPSEVDQLRAALAAMTSERDKLAGKLAGARLLIAQVETDVQAAIRGLA